MIMLILSMIIYVIVYMTRRDRPIKCIFVTIITQYYKDLDGWVVSVQFAR